MIPSTLEKAVASHPFVQGMKPEHVSILSECAMLMEFSQGQLIFQEGDISNRFYLIQQGRARLETQRPNGETVSIQTIGAGDILGWSWLFPPYYWHFSACALEPTRAVFFYGTRLRERCEEDRDFGYELMKRMAAVVVQRLQATVQESLRLARETG
jgi:CRP-like cAMP-binding protein